MNLKFKFDCEKKWTVVDVPPNLMLAIKETTQQRKNSILLYSVLTLLSLFLYANATRNIIPIFLGYSWGAIFIITTIVFTALLTKWILDKKSESLRLFCCIMTKGFDQYIDNIIDPICEMLSHEYIVQYRLPNSEVKKLEKIVITAQLLKELHSECLDEDYEIHESVSFLEKHIWDIEGFKIERVNYENKKAKKHKRNRRPAIPIRRSTHNCQRNGRKN